MSPHTCILKNELVNRRFISRLQSFGSGVTPTPKEIWLFNDAKFVNRILGIIEYCEDDQCNYCHLKFILFIANEFNLIF